MQGDTACLFSACREIGVENRPAFVPGSLWFLVVVSPSLAIGADRDAIQLTPRLWMACFGIVGI